ncbi:DUF2218 domain-containing protein [Nocardia sp. NPDC020380]|uniref:DUF2218 domain-containing protein n=1 Tax=Nocardia sp. NPDC020380 TaxID=3364309 RepID=UPI00379B91EB
MTTMEGRVAIADPDRYVRQFCKHANALAARGHYGFRGHDGTEHAALALRVEQTGTAATIHVEPYGLFTLHSEPGVLLVRIEGSDAAGLERLRRLVDEDLNRFGHRRLTAEWLPAGTEGFGSR